MPKTPDLRTAGLKVTPPRVKVLRILEGADQHHLSAEDVYKKLSDAGEEVSLATVYRVLTQFESAGLVNRRNFEGGPAVFELDLGEHHDHMVCLKCGGVEEFVDALIEGQLHKLAKQSEFDVTDHSFTIYGICRGCKKSN